MKPAAAFWTILMTCLFMFPQSSVAEDGDQMHLELNTKNRALSLMFKRDFAALEAMSSTFRDQKARLPNGEWLLDAFYDSIKLLATGSDAEDMFTQYSKIFDAWRAAYPNSPTPMIAKAQLLHYYAWHVRGTKYADGVFENQWKVFGEKASEAYKLLNEAPDFVKSDPRWYSLTVSVMRSLGADIESAKTIALEGIKRDPGYYGTYISIMVSRFPQWGGSFDLVDQWVNEASAKSKDGPAPGLYAKLYWTAEVYLQREHFAQLDVDWTRMKRETDMLLATYPSVGNKERALKFSCITNDPEEVLSRYAAVRSLAPSLRAVIEPSQYCRWPSVAPKLPGVISPDDLQSKDGPRRTSVSP